MVKKMKKKVLAMICVSLTILAMVSMVSAKTTYQRVVFQRQTEPINFVGNREPDLTLIKKVSWNISLYIMVNFPVDIEASDDDNIDLGTSNDVACKLTTPINEGNITFIIDGSLDVEKLLKTSHRDFHKEIMIPVTTPLAEKTIPRKIVIAVPVTSPIAYVIIKPTLYLTSSVIGKVSVQGDATISKSDVSWNSNGDIETVTINCNDNAEVDSEITLTLKDFSYHWNAEVDVEIRAALLPTGEGVHLWTSNKRTIGNGGDISANSDITLDYDLNIVPEFSPITLVFGLLIISTIAVFIKRKKLFVKT